MKVRFEGEGREIVTIIEDNDNRVSLTDYQMNKLSQLKSLYGNAIASKTTNMGRSPNVTEHIRINLECEIGEPEDRESDDVEDLTE